ncbi:MAG: hypothetical protein ACLP2Y_02365 [Limisphaerales bacterium]
MRLTREKLRADFVLSTGRNEGWKTQAKFKRQRLKQNPTEANEVNEAGKRSQSLFPSFPSVKMYSPFFLQ